MTDHRLKKTVSGVAELLSGTSLLDRIISELHAQEEASSLANLAHEHSK